MAILQILAARLAGVDKLVYHTFSRQFSEAYEEGLQLVETKLLVPKSSEQGEVTSISLANIVDQITDMDFEWGESDGN
jgi:hypothetical protein